MNGGARRAVAGVPPAQKIDEKAKVAPRAVTHRASVAAAQRKVTGERETHMAIASAPICARSESRVMSRARAGGEPICAARIDTRAERGGAGAAHEKRPRAIHQGRLVTSQRARRAKGAARGVSVARSQRRPGAVPSGYAGEGGRGAPPPRPSSRPPWKPIQDAHTRA